MNFAFGPVHVVGQVAVIQSMVKRPTVVVDVVIRLSFIPFVHPSTPPHNHASSLAGAAERASVNARGCAQWIAFMDKPAG